MIILFRKRERGKKGKKRRSDNLSWGLTEQKSRELFRAVFSPLAKLNLFGRKRKKFEKLDARRMQKAMGKNEEEKEEEAKFAESSIASEEIRRPFQFYPIREEFIVNHEAPYARFLNTFSAFPAFKLNRKKIQWKNSTYVDLQIRLWYAKNINPLVTSDRIISFLLPFNVFSIYIFFFFK